MSRRTAALCLVVCALAAVAYPAAAQDVDKTLQDPKNAGSCITKFQGIILSLYQNTTDLKDCGARITQAMNATTKAQCPAGDSYQGSSVIVPGSPTHKCMNQNNTQIYIDRWTDFIRGCEVMNIAARTGGGESESGLNPNQQSCFPLFNSFGDFQNWLNDASPYGGKAVKVEGAASALRPMFAAAAAAVVLALSLVF